MYWLERFSHSSPMLLPVLHFTCLRPISLPTSFRPFYPPGFSAASNSTGPFMTTAILDIPSSAIVLSSCGGALWSPLVVLKGFGLFSSEFRLFQLLTWGLVGGNVGSRFRIGTSSAAVEGPLSRCHSHSLLVQNVGGHRESFLMQTSG